MSFKETLLDRALPLIDQVHNTLYLPAQLLISPAKYCEELKASGKPREALVLAGGFGLIAGLAMFSSVVLTRDTSSGFAMYVAESAVAAAARFRLWTEREFYP